MSEVLKVPPQCSLGFGTKSDGIIVFFIAAALRREVSKFTPDLQAGGRLPRRGVRFDCQIAYQGNTDTLATPMPRHFKLSEMSPQTVVCRVLGAHAGK